jgi:pimeloyl-ACP methyl ester carboxylesterase
MNAVVTASNPTFVLVRGSGATSFLWSAVVTEIVLRGHRALPVELPGHGFDTTFPRARGVRRTWSGSPALPRRWRG